MLPWDDICFARLQHAMILTITLQMHSLLQLAMAAFLSGDGHGRAREKDLHSSTSYL